MRIVYVVGTRPNFVKTAPVIAALRERLPQGRHALVHTGQHYDRMMSAVFLEELGVPAPDHMLEVGSGSHARQTALTMERLEPVLEEERPELVVVPGDVNSTLAAVLTAVKMGIPVAHVEAGLRSFDPTMPEEVNRRVTDSLSTLLFVTSPEGLVHLAREGADPATLHLVGNPMIDTLLANVDRFDPARAKARLDLPASYAVATLHRPANVDDPLTARTVVVALAEVAAALPVVVPLHPRGRRSLRRAGLDEAAGVRVVDPLGYIDFLSLVRGARLVVTDSGGIQEETTVLDVPCLTLRPNTERPITITHGTNRLVTAGDVAKQAAAILDGAVRFPGGRPPLWDGRAGHRIADVIAGVV